MRGAGHTITSIVDVTVVFGTITAVSELTDAALEFALERFGFLVLAANVGREAGFGGEGFDF